MNQTSPTIHIVDDDSSMRTALSRLLRAQGFNVCSYASAGEFLLVAHPRTPGCVLLDLCMPGPSGLELQQALAKEDEPLPVIFLTGYGDVAASVTAMKSGAVDFLTKPVKREALLAAVSNALSRDAEMRAMRENLNAVRIRYKLLTLRERDVFAGVVSGKLNKQIAAKLGTCERTIKAHRARIMEKMNARSLANLVRLAEQLHLPVDSDQMLA